MARLPPLVSRRDDNNNPVWAVEAPVEIIRLDNSLALTEHMGEFRTPGAKKIIGTISRAIGGFVFIVTDNTTISALRSTARMLWSVYSRTVNCTRWHRRCRTRNLTNRNRERKGGRRNDT